MRPTASRSCAVRRAGLAIGCIAALAACALTPASVAAQPASASASAPAMPSDRSVQPDRPASQRTAAQSTTASVGTDPGGAEAPLEPWWEFRADFGGEFNASPHGVVDIGVRKGPFTAQLLTDTLDVRYAPGYESWRWWAGARVEAYTAGLLPSPWSDGAPAPQQALAASYIGLDGGLITYLPHGFYVGGQASARGYTFSQLDKTTVPIPEDTLVATPEVLLGFWSPGVEAQARAGADVRQGHVAPRASGEIALRPAWQVAPFLEARGGWARRQDFLTRTRLGGLNPYVVPLAGAGWAEFYVQNYGAVRAGPSVAGEYGELAVFADAVVFDERSRPLYGFGGRVRFQSDALFLDTAAGWSPNLPRTGGHAPVTVWVVAGLDWVPY